MKILITGISGFIGSGLIKILSKSKHSILGISRRMEFLGEINNQGHKTILIDDYGHHPTEIKSTIEANSRSFKRGFFFKTHLHWNDLPSELRGETNPGVFKSNLKKHLWDLMINPD